jgi:TonB family protein
MTGDTLSEPKAQAAKTSVIHRPDWMKKPTGEDLAWAYPERAARLELSGKATIACDVTTQGGLIGCRVTSETPLGEGFGAAALKLSPHFQMTPSSDPKHLSKVTIPIVFQVPEPETLMDLTRRDFARASDWASTHVKAPPAELSVAVVAVLGLLIAGLVLMARARRLDVAKDLTGPNSERRKSR